MMTTTNHPYQQAASAYQGMYETNMGGFEIIVELYKGIIRNISTAKAAYQDGDLEEMCTLIEKTNKILIALQSHLNHEQGGEAAASLNSFYTGIFGSLSKVLRQDDPAAEFDNILESIKPVYEIWCKHAQNAAAPPATEPLDAQT